MNLRQLQHFVLVAQERNFRRASERANLSQPALSHSIKALERDLGVQLFERTKHSVKLTAVGETVLKRAQSVLFEAENLTEEVGNLKSGEAGHLRVGLVPTYAYSFGGKAIAQWMADRPDVSVEAVYNSSQVLSGLLQEEELDFFVCDTRHVPSSPEIEVEPFGEFGGGLFCRKDHPVLASDTRDRTALFQYGFASVKMPEIMRLALAAEFGADGSNKPFLALECDAITVLRQAVLATDLIWLANRFNVAEDVAAGRLVEIETKLELRVHWAIARKRGRVLPPAAFPLMELMKSLPIAAMEAVEGAHGDVP
ncbi:LysR family transcriptional regulator [Marimonas arenosa]|uniref:LysR family transcriptional regulator n=1 Tax=Marimonas arenosa TaxID=1795305 RepID=A0AAE3WDW8_9RHOB|nr:LysR family transcriptional regulator [Marimonas arenosa]MDQ2091211.1 LysR family transcriptional regulator [Marimonas arenosa]